jgi:RNA-directed DNA polymerase
VLRNKGAAGVDGVTVGELKGLLQERWPDVKAALLYGSYQPQAVRQVDIPKAGGGSRQLGIPTVLDRLIQQALHQMMSPIFEQGFSDHSDGFRPRRSAAQAVLQARNYAQSGHRWVSKSRSKRKLYYRRLSAGIKIDLSYKTMHKI